MSDVPSHYCKNGVFTSESVSEGHPDKVCDQISDGLLDAIYKLDPKARVAIETAATTNHITLLGEVTAKDGVLGYAPRTEKLADGSEFTRQEIVSVGGRPVADIVRDIVRNIGYDEGKFGQAGFSAAALVIDNRLHGQSADISAAVGAQNEGAGDQGMMFGYACDETPQLMPAPISLAHSILRKISEARHAGLLPKLGPDAKSQVTLQYKNGKPVAVDTILVSSQHSSDIGAKEVREMIRPYVESALTEAALPGGVSLQMPAEDKFIVNPSGKFVIGGPDGDAGLTGRKIIVDTYGGAAPHGGGAFSGKDPTKVDRSAAYAARYLAKNVVAAGLAKSCTIQLSYAIGVAKPISVHVDTHGTAKSKISDEQLGVTLQNLVDLSPRGIREKLQLNQPIYAETAAFGHFGRESNGQSFPWEKTDLVDKLKEATKGFTVRLAGQQETRSASL